MAEVISLKNTKAKFPDTDVWCVIWNDERTELKGYSSIATTQVIATKWSQIDYYDSESEWLEILSKNGIDVSSFNDE